MNTVACVFCLDRIDEQEGAPGHFFRWSPEEMGGAGLQDGAPAQPGEPCCTGPAAPRFIVASWPWRIAFYLSRKPA